MTIFQWNFHTGGLADATTVSEDGYVGAERDCPEVVRSAVCFGCNTTRTTNETGLTSKAKERECRASVLSAIQKSGACTMYCSRFATALVCTALLGACRSFQIPSAVKRQSPQSRNMRRTIRTSGTTTAAGSLVDLTSRQRTGACNAEDEGADGGGKDGDGIDYSADPLTGFLGKFLPSGDNKRKPSPQAKDLVSLVHNKQQNVGVYKLPRMFYAAAQQLEMRHGTPGVEMYK